MTQQVKQVHVPNGLVVGIKDKHIVMWGYTKYWYNVYEFMKHLSIPL